MLARSEGPGAALFRLGRDPARAVKGAARVVFSPSARANLLHAWRRQRFGEPPLPPGPIREVIVLCHGNICRSPFAAALLAELRPELSVRSAGLFAGEGNRADPSAHRVASRRGVDLSSHLAHALDSRDVVRADLLLAMEATHVSEIARRWPGARERTRLLGDFLLTGPYIIPDPWGRGEDFFEDVFRRIETAVRRLAARLEHRGE